MATDPAHFNLALDTIRDMHAAVHFNNVQAAAEWYAHELDAGFSVDDDDLPDWIVNAASTALAEVSCG